MIQRGHTTIKSSAIYDTFFFFFLNTIKRIRQFNLLASTLGTYIRVKQVAK